VLIALLLVVVVGVAGATAWALRPEPVADPVLLAVGDIATCDTEGDEETARLLDELEGTVATLGDTVYESGTSEEFDRCYAPSWGRHKNRIRPVPGNHDYRTDDAAPYYQYFGAAAGDPDEGWYSYDLGSWHIIALNSELSMEEGSDQWSWLEDDLAAHPTVCTAAYWHNPRFSSGYHGDDELSGDVWRILYKAGVDVALNGHDHNYERFAPQDPEGDPDPTGIHEFIVGTGGIDLREVESPQPNSEVLDNSSWGLLQLTLHPDSFDWEFVGVPDAPLTDTGTAACHEGERS
jgi:3',5'-cyclic AMP phosphodiesterase CpdA